MSGNSPKNYTQSPNNVSDSKQNRAARYENLSSNTIQVQGEPRLGIGSIAYPGMKGSYSESVAKRLCTTPVSCATFAEAVKLAENGGTDTALLPIENTTEGGVGESNDLLFETELKILSETYLRVNHCLIGIGNEKSVKTVYSHPQALGQCRKFINDKKTVPVYNTAWAVEMVKKLNDETVAAIASQEAARLHGMKVIRSNINDVQKNYTRFLLLGKELPMAVRKNPKTTICFMLEHEPGALAKIIHEMRGVNLTRIESRPIKSGEWEYGFVVDFVGHEADPGINVMLKTLKGKTKSMKVLGSYSTVLI